jgi:heat shock protein HtpX
VLNTFVVFLSRILARVIDNATDGKLGYLGYQLAYISLQILLGIGATLIVMRFSRYREYRADLGSAELVGKAKMISALRRLKELSATTIATDDGKLAAFKIASGEKKSSLFASHPSLDDRIRALEENYQLA